MATTMTATAMMTMMAMTTAVSAVTKTMLTTCSGGNDVVTATATMATVMTANSLLFSPI